MGGRVVNVVVVIVVVVLVGVVGIVDSAKGAALSPMLKRRVGDAGWLSLFAALGRVELGGVEELPHHALEVSHGVLVRGEPGGPSSD